MWRFSKHLSCSFCRWPKKTLFWCYQSYINTCYRGLLSSSEALGKDTILMMWRRFCVIFFSFSFLIRYFKPTRRKPNHSLDPAELVLDSGTKAARLVGSENRGHAFLSASYRNVSAALSLLNQVCNSIYSIEWKKFFFLLLKICKCADWPYILSWPMVISSGVNELFVAV